MFGFGKDDAMAKAETTGSIPTGKLSTGLPPEEDLIHARSAITEVLSMGRKDFSTVLGEPEDRRARHGDADRRRRTTRTAPAATTSWRATSTAAPRPGCGARPASSLRASGRSKSCGPGSGPERGFPRLHGGRVAIGRDSHHIMVLTEETAGHSPGLHGFHRSGFDARPLRRPGGAQECERGGDQKRLPQARQKAASRRQQGGQERGVEVRRAQRRLRNRRRRGQAQGVRPRRDRCRGQAALPRLRGLRRGAGSGRRRLRPRQPFRNLHLGAGRRRPSLRRPRARRLRRRRHRRNPQGHVRRPARRRNSSRRISPSRRRRAATSPAA